MYFLGFPATPALEGRGSEACFDDGLKPLYVPYSLLEIILFQ